ncbi:HAMP domain-containing sensor histidine kinase [Rosettibacter firmus]|uniref:HAMP domain-containing sensor histidine kinase n=1 Tax=Rosettibacter firmus TaxID=3111522 RepID=UPI00336C1A98
MIKLYTSSLRAKIFLGFTVILLIMFLAAIWSIYNFYRLNESINLTMQENYSSIIAADNIGKALDDQLHGLTLMYNQNFEEGEKLFEKSKEDFFYWYDKARKSAYTQEEKNILDSLNYEYDNFLKYLYNNIDYKIYINKKGKAFNIEFVTIVNQIKDIKKKSNKILEINHQLLNKAVDNTKTITQTATFFIVVILLGAIFISIVFSTKFSNYVVRPLNKLRKSVEHISEGNFNEKIEIDENSDEINSLAEEFNKMSEKLQKYEQLNLSKILFEKKKSELVIESMNEPVLMVDENLNVLLTNKSFNEIFKDVLNDKSKLNKLLNLSGLENKAENQDQDIYHDKEIVVVKDKDGSRKYFKMIEASLNIPEKEMKGTVYVFNDITKYQELDKMKSEFVAKVSHELKTPLTSMGMAIGIIEDGVAGELTDKQKELITSIKEDYERLNKLVYEILELTKLEANRNRIKFENFEARKLLEHVFKKFEPIAKEKNIELKVSDFSEGAMIKGSYDHMISAIENLIYNSIKFTPNNGKISVEQKVENGKINIIISDTGIGISPENLKKIFDKFIQIDDISPGSLGLGLSIAKEIIEIHDGEIKAFSQLGKGSTFQIIIPAA